MNKLIKRKLKIERDTRVQTDKINTLHKIMLKIQKTTLAGYNLSVTHQTISILTALTDPNTYKDILQALEELHSVPMLIEEFNTYDLMSFKERLLLKELCERFNLEDKLRELQNIIKNMNLEAEKLEVIINTEMVVKNVQTKITLDDET